MKLARLKRHQKAKEPLPGADEEAARVPGWRGQTREFLSFAGFFVGVLLVVILIKAFVIQPYIVDGQSMEPTLNDHDRLLVDRIPRTIARIDGHAYVPKRGNIIVFNQSGIPGYNGPRQLIKRVIGLPGEEIIIRDNKLTIFSSADRQGFDPDFTLGYHPSTTQVMGSVDTMLGSNQIFVLGDNRNNSEDSRYFGPVNLNQIVGKLSYRIMPFSKAEHF